VLGNQMADLLTILAESVGGAVYGDENGKVVFRGLDWQIHLPSDPVDYTVGNVDPSDIAPVSWRMSDRREDFVTQVIVGRETDATPLTFDSGTGQREYGVETWEATDLICSSSTQLQRVGLRILRTRGFGSARRVDGLTLNAQQASDVGRDLMWRVDPFVPYRLRCRHESSHGLVFDQKMFVTGVTHRMTPGEWECELNLDSSTPWEAVAGSWDEAAWDKNVWSATV
jgi:hypothetical protein